MALQRKNNSKSHVENDPLAIAGATLNIHAGDGALFPTTGDFKLTIWDKATYNDPGNDSNMEIVLATARTDDAITITRAQEETADVEHAQNSAVEMLITAGTLNELVPYTGATADVDLGVHNLTTTGTIDIASMIMRGGDAEFYVGSQFKFYDDLVAITTAFGSSIADQFYIENAGGSAQAILNLGSLTTGRTFTFPDKDGTFAMLDDISDITDGTYTVGKGTVQDGTITFVNGRITAIQEASNV